MKNKHLIIKLEHHDIMLFRNLLILFNEIFESDTDTIPGDIYLKSLLANPDFLVFVLLIEDKVLGGVTAYLLPKYYSEASELYLYDVAIHPDLQRQGFGKEMIETVKQYCLSHRISEAFVDAHEEDKHAYEFYQSTGGVADKVFHFTYKL
ncbi:MAG: GNAT family N-acetyltransferase [Saprospiraceae bacterium]